VFVLPGLVCSVSAQDTLDELQRRFRAEAQQLAATSPSFDQRKEQLDRHVTELYRFVSDTAGGDDRWNGRLMLADLELVRGNRKAAGDALRAIDRVAAPALVLVTAATMAQHLGMTAERDALVSAAVEKPAPVADRMAMARLLMTVLLEVERGDKLFADALQAATDDDQRAFVRWHRADALRDREDLPENSAFDELDKLAKELPSTYWGSVAKDRLRATQLQPGDEAIDFKTQTLAGQPFQLSAQRGKAVVLAFWSQGDYDTPRLIEILEELRREHKDQLVVLGICLDRDVAAIRTAVAELGIDFPVVADGKGAETDAALRWFVEGPVLHVIDKNGKVAGLGLQTGTREGRADVAQTVDRAVR
jgi:peroxiredoxin